MASILPSGTVNGTTQPNSIDALPTGISGMSPDEILEYCETKLNGLDTQISSLEKQQETQINEQNVVTNLQSQLEQSGGADWPSGAAGVEQMSKCVQDFNAAIKQLPPGDPLIGKLQSQLSAMEKTYGYQAPNALTSQQSTERAAALPLASSFGAPSTAFLTVNQINGLQQNGVLTNPPNQGDWDGTTGAIGDIASTVKSNAQLQMLSLQDLVSQEQDAIEQATNMMSKADDTLLDEAKNIG